MEILKDKYTITELSERLNVTNHTLRYYEKEFCLDIPKDERGRRYYIPEHANLMYKIKRMRDDGLEIKAIKKILLSEDIISEPPPVVSDDTDISIISVKPSDTSIEIRKYFDELKEQISSSISCEVNSAKEHLSKEMNKTKLELGACVENSIRKLESKMDKHFMEVDRSLGLWREKNKGGLVNRLVKKVFK